MKSTFSRTISILAMPFVLWSCITSQDGVQVNPKPQEDETYLRAYESHSRKQNVFINFETRYTVTATYLSPEFRAAFAKRFESLYSAPQPFLEEASSKAGFFVTIFAPEDEGYNLTDDQLWSIQLRSAGKTHKPFMVKRLGDKDRWLPFFVDVHRWSQEYLILFDTPSISTGDKLLDKKDLALLFANADAKVTLNW